MRRKRLLPTLLPMSVEGKPIKLRNRTESESYLIACNAHPRLKIAYIWTDSVCSKNYANGSTRPVSQSETLFNTPRIHGPRRNLCMVARVVLKKRSRPGISAKNSRGRGKKMNTGGVKIGRFHVREKVGTLVTTHSLRFLVQSFF